MHRALRLRHLLILSPCLAGMPVVRATDYDQLAATTATTAATCQSACNGSGVTGFSFLLVNGDSFGLATCLGDATISCSAAPASVLYYSPDPSGSTVVVNAPYDCTNVTSASATIQLPDGSALLLVDSFAVASHAEGAFGGGSAGASSFLSFSRVVSVVIAGGVVGAGFASRLSLALVPHEQASNYTVFMPGVYYNDGGASSGAAWIPKNAIGGDRLTGGAAVAREDRLGAPLVLLQNAASGVVAGVLRPVSASPATILNDTLTGAPIVDARLDFASLGSGPCDDGGATACTALVALLPGCEFDRTYMSGAPAAGLLRFHPLALGLSSRLDLVLLASAGPSGAIPGRALDNESTGSNQSADARFVALVDWAMRGAIEYYNPLLRDDINVSEAYEAQVSALADCYRPTFPISGVPTGFDKQTGVAYSTVLEQGFVGPQLRMAVALLYSALKSGNETRASIATAILDSWVATTGPGFGHAVWDTAGGDGGGAWIDDGPGSVVYLRRAVVSHHHALEAAALAEAALSHPISEALRGLLRDGQTASAWRDWALSLADALVLMQVIVRRGGVYNGNIFAWPVCLMQASDGSFARQYAVPTTPGGIPMPTEPSKTATALPIRFLVEAARAPGGLSGYLSAAIAAAEYAWAAFGARGLYVGAAIDNPDVVDKESALFAMDGFLALAEAAMSGSIGDVNASLWISRASAAAITAASWVQLTRIPNPLDAPEQDFLPTDTSAGFGIIAVGHSGSDSFASMFAWPLFRLCALNGGDGMHARMGRLALANTKQGLDLSGARGFAQRGFSSELWSFSVGWDVFSGHNDGRGVGDPHFVPWTAANGAYGVAQVCAGSAASPLPAACAVGLPLGCD